MVKCCSPVRRREQLNSEHEAETFVIQWGFISWIWNKIHNKQDKLIEQIGQ
ncbi:hypothetical protein [Scytonema sp. NUACC21]